MKGKKERRPSRTAETGGPGAGTESGYTGTLGAHSLRDALHVVR
jgi:hypothetical protein